MVQGQIHSVTTTLNSMKDANVQASKRGSFNNILSVSSYREHIVVL